MIKIVQEQGVSLPEMVANAIRVARTMKGMSVQQLAYASGVSPSTINNIDAGRAFPSTDTLAKLFGAMGASISIDIDEKVIEE